MNKKWLTLAIVSGIIISLDQLVKIYIHTHYQVGESVSVLQGYFNITYVRNLGAAFGFLSTAYPAFREVFFLSTPPMALVIILMILRSVENRDWPQILALSSIFGGAIGNYIDRVRFRYVIDFLDFHWEEKYTWPAFNVADMAIVGGVGLLMLLLLLEGRRLKS